MNEGLLSFFFGFLDSLWLNLPHQQWTPNILGLLNCFTNSYSVCITNEEGPSSQVSK